MKKEKKKKKWCPFVLVASCPPWMDDFQPKTKTTVRTVSKYIVVM